MLCGLTAFFGCVELYESYALCSRMAYTYEDVHHPLIYGHFYMSCEFQLSYSYEAQIRESNCDIFLYFLCFCKFYKILITFKSSTSNERLKAFSSVSLFKSFIQIKIN